MSTSTSLCHRLRVGEHEADVAAVLLRRAVGRVVHLEDAASSRPARTWPCRPADSRCGRRPARSQPDGPPARAASALSPSLLGGMIEDDDVMHHRAIARPAFGRFDPLVLRPARIDGEVLVLDGPSAGTVIRLVAPCRPPGRARRICQPVPQLPRRGQVAAIPLRAAVVDPVRRSVCFLFVAQAASLAKLPMLRIGEPGRHAAFVITSRIISAQPTTSSYSVSANGPISPGRWHSTQWSWKNPRDLVRVGHFAVPSILAHAADQAAVGLGDGLGSPRCRPATRRGPRPGRACPTFGSA